MSSVLNQSPPSGISVLISGAGVGGLMAALEFRRRGCEVRVFERTKANSQLGDSFTIGTSALKAFNNYPELSKREREVAYSPLVAYANVKGEIIKDAFDFKDEVVKVVPSHTSAARLARHNRPKLHNILLEQFTKMGLEVEWDKEVVEYFDDAENGAGVVLKDGTRVEADLVVAADGVRGNSWPLIAGKPIPAKSSGHAIFRVAYPVDLAMADPMVAERFPLRDGRSVMELWTGPDMSAAFWRNQDRMEFAINHPDQNTAEESWSHRISPEEVLKFTATIPDWPEVADRVIKATPPDTLVDWKLMWRDPQPTWVSPRGRVVQLGDAAHTFLPSSGNGGTQAIEDAVSLAACISVAGKSGIPNAARVHNLLRFERVSCLQAIGVLNQEARNTKRKGDPTEIHKVFGEWLLSHDPEQYALDNYEKALDHLQNDTPFKNTNIPARLNYRPWTIDSLIEQLDKGEPTLLDEDWS